MHTQILTVNTQDRPHEVERSEEAAIAGEIARRFIELREASSAHRATMLISKMHALSQVHPEALWLVMSLLTGDLTEITRSYADMGKAHAKSKQAVEQERSRALEGIQRHFPGLAKAVIDLRHITSQIGPPQQENDDRP
jgi:predicted component of type VI protein secretion system